MKDTVFLKAAQSCNPAASERTESGFSGFPGCAQQEPGRADDVHVDRSSRAALGSGGPEDLHRGPQQTPGPLPVVQSGHVAGRTHTEVSVQI